MGRFSELYPLEPDPFNQKTSQTGLDEAYKTLRICLFRDVKNSSELKDLLRSGEIDCSIIRAELVLEPFQLLAAANRAAHSCLFQRLATKGIHPEIVYSLSPTKNITDSLSTFGLQEESTNLIVALVDDQKGAKMSKIAKRIKGKPVKMAQLANISDYDLIKQVYHVRTPDLNKSTILDNIVTRIVSKDYVA